MDTSDAQLLERFLKHQDEAAFEALVRRHGPMVLGVCRRALNDPHDARDACQATFLVLASQAASLRKRASLGSWLYGVAVRVARKAQSSAAERRRHERRAAEMASKKEAREEEAWRELRPLLDEELGCLPEKYRVPIVLCYLQGKTNKEAAGELGWTKGTISGRLARARELLKGRLARRGVVLPVGLLAALCTKHAAAVELPGAFVAATAKAASLVALGQAAGTGGTAGAAGVVSEHVAALTKGALKMIFMAKVKLAAAVFLAVALFGGGAGVGVAAWRTNRVERRLSPPHDDAAPLAGKPSEKKAGKKLEPYRDDPQIAPRIKALKPGHGLFLPKFNVLPKNVSEYHHTFKKMGPSRRGFCNKMVYAPERKTALYCGGDHGTPHRLNDVWEFHLGSNTWHLICPPANDAYVLNLYWRAIAAAKQRIKNKQDVKKNKAVIAENEKKVRAWYKSCTVEDGYLQAKGNGGPVRPWHTWDGLTYDPVARRLLWAVLDTDNIPGLNARSKDYYEKHYRCQRIKTRDYAKWTGQDAEKLLSQLKPSSSMYMYDIGKKRWFRQLGKPPFPYLRGMGGSLTYIPDLKKTIWYCAAGNVIPGDYAMWAYDASKNTWEQLRPNGGKSIVELVRSGLAPGSELQAAYSPRHKKLVAVRREKTFIYDVVKNVWSKVPTDNTIAGWDSDSVFAYDSNADVFLLLGKKGQAGRNTAYWMVGPWILRAFDLKTGKWTTVKPKGDGFPLDAGPKGYQKQPFAGYYDEGENAFVLYCAKTQRTWIYRHAAARK